MYWKSVVARSTKPVERVFVFDSAGDHMVSRKSGEPSPESIARADRQRAAAEEGKQAMAVIERQRIAVRENMARLRTLREAEETRVQQAELAAPKAKKKSASKKAVAK
jgi:hypothetical protein